MIEPKSLIDRIFDLKQEYENMKDMIDLKGPDSQEIDFQPMFYPDLLRIRKDLSCLSLDLAKSTGKYQRDFKNAEAKRKTQYFFKKRECIQLQKMKIGEAETEAEVETSDLRISAATNEGLYSTGKLLLSQCNEVLKSLNQDISIIKKEYESINNIR